DQPKYQPGEVHHHHGSSFNDCAEVTQSGEGLNWRARNKQYAISNKQRTRATPKALPRISRILRITRMKTSTSENILLIHAIREIRGRDFAFGFAFCLLPIAYCLSPIAYRLLLIAFSSSPSIPRRSRLRRRATGTLPGTGTC